MNQTFNAIVAEQTGEKSSSASLKQLQLVDLPDDDVLVEVAFSTLNYKDGLAVSGQGRICRFFPMVCGIDLAGTVLESKSGEFQPGDQVLVNGFGMSESHWGGYSQRQRVRAEWLVRVPAAFTLEQTMAIGTAGYTAMLCVQALEDHAVETDTGPIVVSGASGGVGSVAVMLLNRLGYEVVAATGRASENEAFLSKLGADRLIDRGELSRPPKPLESERWAGAIDAVGADTLASILAQTRYGGTVAACGLAGGFKLPTTVMPFILRGVTLVGIDSVQAPLSRRQQAWDKLAELTDLDLLSTIYRVEAMSDLPQLAHEILAGKIRGRVVIDVNR